MQFLIFLIGWATTLMKKALTVRQVYIISQLGCGSREFKRNMHELLSAHMTVFQSKWVHVCVQVLHNFVVAAQTAICFYE